MKRARDVEAQLTDEEHFSLLISVMGTNEVLKDKDPRIPDGVPMSAGYTPGIPRLGIPALLMSDASLGVTNPGYREGIPPQRFRPPSRSAPALTRNSPADPDSWWVGKPGAKALTSSSPADLISTATRATAGTSSTCPRDFALGGLDQESGAQIDVMMWGQESFTAPLRAAYAAGDFPKERLSEMAQRILFAIFDVGIDRWEGTPDVDLAAHADIALETARQGIVLLKNDGMLPLAAPSSAGAPFRIAVIGGHAQLGVPAGCGSSAVTPPGGYAEIHSIGGPGIMGSMRNLYLRPSSPLAELQKLLPDAEIEYDPGMSPGEAALLARRSDVAIVFGIRVEGEGYDNADLSLPWGQDAVIEAVAEANPNAVVVLETGNPVAMPWLPKVRAVLAAWYPGQCGGQAIAEILAGVTNPSGKLPLTFPTGLDQTPRPELPGLGTPWGTPTTVNYHEGSDVGYRWFAKTGQEPLFPFGHGLSYTRFGRGDLTVQDRGGVRAEFTVTNVGPRRGADVPQLYVLEDPAGPRMRLLGFERVDLEPGESRTVSLAVDSRLLASYNTARGQWHTAGGSYRLALGHSAGDCTLEADVSLTEAWFGR